MAEIILPGEARAPIAEQKTPNSAHQPRAYPAIPA